MPCRRVWGCWLPSPCLSALCTSLYPCTSGAQFLHTTIYRLFSPSALFLLLIKSCACTTHDIQRACFAPSNKPQQCLLKSECKTSMQQQAGQQGRHAEGHVPHQECWPTCTSLGLHSRGHLPSMHSSSAQCLHPQTAWWRPGWWPRRGSLQQGAGSGCGWVANREPRSCGRHLQRWQQHAGQTRPARRTRLGHISRLVQRRPRAGLGAHLHRCDGGRRQAGASLQPECLASADLRSLQSCCMGRSVGSWQLSMWLLTAPAVCSPWGPRRAGRPRSGRAHHPCRRTPAEQSNKCRRQEVRVGGQCSAAAQRGAWKWPCLADVRNRRSGGVGVAWLALLQGARQPRYAG